MKTKQKLRTLYAIADMAVKNGLDIVVELSDRNDGSKTLNGFLTDTASSDGSVILRAYHPDPMPAQEDEGHDVTDDDDDPGPEPYEEIDGVKYFADREVGSDG